VAIRPLALIDGRIHEHPDSGAYPLIRLAGGRLWAGGAGNNVYLLHGRLVEAREDGNYVAPGYWGDGDAPYVDPGYWCDGYADAYAQSGYVNPGYTGCPGADTNGYVDPGYVADGYVSAGADTNGYVDPGYVADGYVSGSVTPVRYVEPGYVSGGY